MILLLLAERLGAAVLGGRVVDQESGQPLAGVNLRLLDSRLGCASGLDGAFHLDVGERRGGRLLVTHMGYEALEWSLDGAADGPLTLRLRPTCLTRDELVYSTDAREQTTRNATTKVDVVPRETLDRAPSQELSRVLEVVPGISIKRSDGATTNSLSIRGSSNLLGGGVGNRVLLLVDGKPAISADTGGADWSMAPLAILERVEVAKGSYSSLYGSTAMGGVINLVTLREFPKHRTVIQAGYGMGERPDGDMRFRDTPATENHLSVTHTNQLERLGYYLSYTKREASGHRQNSDYLLHTLSNRFRFGAPLATRNWELTLGWSSLNRGFPHSWDSRRRPLHISHHHPEWLDDRQAKESASADLSFQQTGPRSHLRAMAWANLGLSKTLYHDAAIPDTRSDADKLGTRISWDWLGWRRNEWILGVDAQTDRVDGRPDDIFYGRHQTATYAAFAQDQLTLPWGVEGWLEDPRLTAGARVDRFIVHQGRRDTQFSPKLGMALKGTGRLEEWTLRASAGTAFRNPAIADLFLKSVPGNDYSFVANPDLRAEQSRSAELGVAWSGRHLGLDVTHFRYQYRDMIHYRDTGDVSVFEIVNLARARIQGWEVSGECRWGTVGSTVGYTFVDALNQDTGEPLPYQPRHSVNGTAGWSPGKWRLSASLRAVSETERVRFYQTDAPGSYTLLGLKAAYVLGDVEVAGSVENLGDVAYEEMERYRMPGRTWRLDLLFQLGG
jgi:outer membrane cobalamin receptor